MTYVREVTKLTIITLAYIDYFYRIWHWSPWRSGSVGGSWIYVSRVQISVMTCFFFFVLFFLFFLFIFFYVFFYHYYYSANLQIQHYCLYSVSPTLLLLMMPRPPAPSAL